MLHGSLTHRTARVNLPTSLYGFSLRRLLPAAVFGEIHAIAPVRMGLSGAGVQAVSTANGEYILRVQGADADRDFWDQHLLIVRRAAERGVAPSIVHVDEATAAIVSVRINGATLPSVLGNPAVRPIALSDLISRLRALHAIDASGIEERDVVAYGRLLCDTQHRRPGFPEWATRTDPILAELASVLARDTRRVVSHNDMNPGNVLWDGSRSWLVDWEVAGLGHPYYDLAALVTFLDLDAERANELLALQEQSALEDAARATFAALRQLVALLVGHLFLSMVPDLGIVEAPTRSDAPTLAHCYTMMRGGEMDLQTARGQAMFGLAFLRIASS